ncbi:MAG: 2-C-methyl-D-erythritol 2,4-cyclodiphosphate synthase, partial [Sphingomonadales bacterium]
SINSQKPDIVLIHDAARSFVNTATISRVIEKVISTDGGVVPVLPIVDTLKFSKNGFIYNTKSRENLFSAQTPQGFMYSKIYNAHNLLEGMSLPDDASLFEEIGEKVSLVHGSESNFKITTREDLKKAKKLFGITNMETRIGQGFDVHKFEEGDHVTLCGVNISHTQGLKGHSDADVAIHAITDCLLGAISKGDIGEHFPPSDPQWKNAPSSLFLKHVSDLISNQGGVIINIDLTILCEAPKITPHKEKMRKVIAEILNLSISRVSVKATTTERLGFTGREEGIAAMATAAVMINVGNEC